MQSKAVGWVLAVVGGLLAVFLLLARSQNDEATGRAVLLWLFAVPALLIAGGGITLAKAADRRVRARAVVVVCVAVAVPLLLRFTGPGVTVLERMAVGPDSGTAATSREAFGHWSAAGKLQSEGQYDRAIAELDEAIRLETNPNMKAMYLDDRASVWFKKEDYGKAWQDYNAARALGFACSNDPEFVEGLRKASGRQQ